MLCSKWWQLWKAHVRYDEAADQHATALPVGSSATVSGNVAERGTDSRGAGGMGDAMSVEENRGHGAAEPSLEGPASPQVLYVIHMRVLSTFLGTGICHTFRSRRLCCTTLLRWSRLLSGRAARRFSSFTRHPHHEAVTRHCCRSEYERRVRANRSQRTLSVHRLS